MKIPQEKYTDEKSLRSKEGKLQFNGTVRSEPEWKKEEAYDISNLALTYTATAYPWSSLM
jgi:hypothetical protein